MSLLPGKCTRALCASVPFGPWFPWPALGWVPGERGATGTDHHLEVIKPFSEVLVSLWRPVPVFPGLSPGLGPVLAWKACNSTGRWGGGAGTSIHRFGCDLGCPGSTQSLSSDSLCPLPLCHAPICLFVFIKLELIYNVLTLVFLVTSSQNNLPLYSFFFFLCKVSSKIFFREFPSWLSG